jgi:hypothetical protein
MKWVGPPCISKSTLQIWPLFPKQIVLAVRALLVRADLRQRRLANVYAGYAAAQPPRLLLLEPHIERVGVLAVDLYLGKQRKGNAVGAVAEGGNLRVGARFLPRSIADDSPAISGHHKMSNQPSLQILSSAIIPAQLLSQSGNDRGPIVLPIAE